MEKEKESLMWRRLDLMLFLSIFFMAMAVGMFVQEYIIHAKECGSSNFLSFIMGLVIAFILFSAFSYKSFQQ
jgi:hypothetical protein